MLIFEKKMEKEEAIDIVKDAITYDIISQRVREALETLIPEFKESEDEKIKEGLIKYLKADMECNPSQCESFYNKSITWLEKQGDEKHPNSKEDERLRNTTISFLKDFANKGYENAVEYIDWPDALKPQSNWKPTTEQIQTLHAQLVEGAVTYPEDKRVLTTLYEDLMKIFVKN